MTVDNIFKDKQTLKKDIKEEGSDEPQIQPTAFATLYKPQVDHYCLSEVGFIVIEDGWRQESLLDLKQQVGCTLFALQTTDKCVDRFDVIDGVIICKPNEVE